MKKTLRVVLSMLLVASAALSSSAQSLTVSKKGGELVDAKREALTQRAAPASDEKEPVTLGQVKSQSPLSLDGLRSAVSSVRAPKKPVLGEAANLPDIYGALLYSTVSTSYGLYQVPTNSSMSNDLVFTTQSAAYGAVLLDGVYYTIYYQSLLGIINYFTTYGYDIETGDRVYTSSTGSYGNLSMGMSEYNGTVYGIFYNSSANGLRLGTIEFTTSGPVVSQIATLDGSWTAFAIDGNGQGYGIKKGTDNSTLCKINLSDGAVTEVGATGAYPQYISGMAFERKSNRLYWAVCNDDAAYLAELNTTTGEATTLYEFPDGAEYTGLYIPEVPADGAPAAASNLVISFPEGNLSGTVKFNLPATTYNGNAGSGNVNYTVSFNDQVVASGSGAYGAAVTENVTVAAAGSYKVVVAVSNDEGNGPSVKQTLYIGVGVPSTPEVSLVYEGGNMKISWTPVTSTVEGGYIDPKAVVYDVVRYPDAVTVVNGLNANAISQEVEETELLTMYYYTVVAHNGEKQSAAGKSNVVTLGKGYPAPYSCSFDSSDDLSVFTVIDANADGKTWTYYTGAVRIAYNASLAMDDWLITAPIKLEANKLYEIEFDTRAQSASYPERIEVLIGKGNTVADMTTVLLDPTDVTTTSYAHYKMRFVPTATDYYNIGFHGISDKNEYYLYVDNIAVSDGMNADIPAAVSDLTVEPGTNGDLYATISFVSPTKLLSGKDITELTKIDVLMDGEVIFNARPLVGTKITCPAVVDEAGTYTFTVVAYNANGAGDAASVSEYIGIDYPAELTNFKVNETANLGEVKLTWDAVTKDARGNSIEATYNLYDYKSGSLVLLKEGITTNSYTYQAVEAGDQGFVQYALFAVSERGSGNGKVANAIVGTPYTDYFESFANQALSHLLVTSTVNGSPSWSIHSDTTLGGVPSVDGDGGFIAMKGSAVNDESELCFGKISLAGLTEPLLSFYTYHITNGTNNNVNIITVYIDDLSDDAGYQVVYENYVYLTGDQDQWNKVSVDLSDYIGKDIALKISANTQYYVYTTFDAIKVANLVPKDLAVVVDAPATVAPATDFNVNVTVKNVADKAAEGYTVKVKANNVTIKTIEGDALATGTSKTYTVPYAFAAVDEDPIAFSAEVVYAGDADLTNNTSDVVTVTPKVSIYPVPVDLEGEVVPEGVQLTWGEPDLTGSNFADTTEDFEAGVAGDMTYEGWTFVDVDQSPVGGFQNTDVPGITPGTTLASFFVFDADGWADAFAAHSGTKYLAAMFRYDDGTVDDWAISPALTGNAQTVSFYAKSYSASYPEKIEVYYSTGSLDVNDFVKVDGVGGTLSEEWTLVSADLPAGAKYFAIRSCATSSWMLMIDDVTYETGVDFSDLSIVGYNVYRNAVKLNEEPEAECEYLDATAVAQNNEYAVTAVYTVGESKASDKLLISTTGLDQVVAGVEIVGEVGQIVVTGAEGLELSVVAVDGKVVYAATAQAKTVVNLAAGVYVVKAGDKVAKVLVK